MSTPTYAPGTEYLMTLNNGTQLATGGFDDVQSLFDTIKALWDGKREGAITTWEPTKRDTWTNIVTFKSLLNPYTIVAILDMRDTNLVHKVV